MKFIFLVCLKFKFYVELKGHEEENNGKFHILGLLEVKVLVSYFFYFTMIGILIAARITQNGQKRHIFIAVPQLRIADYSGFVKKRLVK